MIKHYLKIAFRNLWKYKTFSVLNITGLALGMAGAMVLLLWIQHQLSVDQFHEKKAGIYKLYTTSTVEGAVQSDPFIPAPLAVDLKKNFPEILDVTRIKDEQQLLRYTDNKINAVVSYVDPSFLNIFSFPLVQGNDKLVLNDPHAVVISETLAKKLFKEEEPVNKIIQIDNNENLLVTGVLKDLPNNTQFKFDCLVPYQLLQLKGAAASLWNEQVCSFVLVKNKTSIEAVNKKITALAEGRNARGNKASVFLYPLEKLWLHSNFENGKPAGGGITVIRFLLILAGIILLIACINFMNLSTARSIKRSKEVGVRKVIGAGRSSLIYQFIGESILLSFIAGLIALGIVQLVLPSFNALTEKHLFVAWKSAYFWLSFGGFVVLTGFLAGVYPAFFLSSFNPNKVLKGVFQNLNGLVTPRKILVVFQFTFAVVLINFTILLHQQTNYLRQRDIGYNKEQLIFHPLTTDLVRNYAVLKEELISSGAVMSISRSSTPISRTGSHTDGITWPGKNDQEKYDVELRTSSEGFVATNAVKLFAGRDIDVNRSPSDTNACIINEAAMKMMASKNPVGLQISYGKANLTVVGVVRDFVSGSPMQAVDPLLIKGSTEAEFINIRLSARQQLADNLNKVTAVLKKHNPNFLTECQFATQDYAMQTKGLRVTHQLTNIFASIAIFISCLGLLGLVIFTAETKVKEIGIRKVFGANNMAVFSLLARGFIKLVILSVFIASPVAWLLMNGFLNPFYYRVDLHWWVMIGAAAMVLIIAIVTISAHALRVAMTNPAQSLRTE